MDPALQHGFWYYNWGNVAGVAGLCASLIGIVFTIWTLITAKSAQQAAIEAKNNATMRSFSNDARRAEVYNRDLIMHLQNSNFDAAVFRSADLFELLREMYEAWPSAAEQLLRADLLSAKAECEQNDKLVRRLKANSQSTSAQEIQRAVNKSNSIHVSIVKVRMGTLSE